MSKSGLCGYEKKNWLVDTFHVYSWFVFGMGLKKKWLVELFHVYIRFVF